MEYITEKGIPLANDLEDYYYHNNYEPFLEFIVEKKYCNIVMEVLEKKNWRWKEGQKPTKYKLKYDPPIILHLYDGVFTHSYLEDEELPYFTVKSNEVKYTNGVCPYCLNKAFLLFNSMECSNPNCKFG